MRALRKVSCQFLKGFLLFKLRSGTHGLNEELGRHRGREGKCMYNLCGEDCQSVGHFLWNCPVYSERCALFLEHLKIILETNLSILKVAI